MHGLHRLELSNVNEIHNVVGVLVKEKVKAKTNKTPQQLAHNE